jgi:large subunit ribosomal protein L17
MRHRVAGRKLGRDTEHRRAMWRNMAVSLFTHGQITTTIPKAKSVKPFVEKLITAAKKGELASRRRVISELGGDPILIREQDDEDVPRNDYGELLREGGRRQGPRLVKYLFEEIAPRYQDRDGGYTRIIKLGRWRKGDGADLCVLQLLGEEEGGPQVAGQYSRRRQKANRRMERAAQLRKGRTGAAASASETAEATAQASDASDTEQEVAAEEPQQQQTADQQETGEDENQQS